MKTVFLFFFLFILINTSFAQVTNVATGLWSNTSNWSNNHVPATNDSVYLSYDVIVDINASCKALNANGHSITINAGITFTLDGNTLDIDGNLYNRIPIGSQVWMKENLNVAHYKNGDTIPQVTDPVQWQNLTTGAWCYNNNDIATGNLYGKLYNWYAVNDPRGLAPQGWHIPSAANWITLTSYLGGQSTAGGPLKSTTGWMSPNTGATNSSGFTALPGGYRNQMGTFADPGGSNGYWWTSTPNGTGNAYSCILNNYDVFVQEYITFRKMGFSVRCLKD